MGRSFKAQKLATHGFINRIIPKGDLLNETIKEAIATTKFSLEAVQQTKRLLKPDDMRDHLKKVVKRENDLLFER